MSILGRTAWLGLRSHRPPHRGRNASVARLHPRAPDPPDVDAFVAAQKALLDVAAKQMAVSVATARRTVDVMNPLPASTLADLTRQTVDTFVAAQRALLDVAAKPPARRSRKPSALPPSRPSRKLPGFFP